MDFIAIDFEIATYDPASICAVGVIVVKNGEIVKKYKRLIQPPENEYDDFHVSRHGINPEDTANEPTFDIIFKEFYPYIGENLILAHNASFDMAALRHTLSYYDLEYPDLKYICTKFISQKTWLGKSSYALDILADELNIQLHHHDPLSDAQVCAEIAMRACSIKELDNIEILCECLDIRIGKIFGAGYSPCKLHDKNKKRISYPSIKTKDIICHSDKFDENSPIFGKSFVFTGTLRSMLRKDAWQKVVDSGGSCADNMRKDTNYLVMGIQDYSRFRSGNKSSKQKKAESLILEGKDIEIISEDDFIKMLIW